MVVAVVLCLDVLSVHAEKTNGAFTIDLPTTLRLANARNLDVQIARERLRQAQADRDVAFSEFLPWISAGAAYRRHDGRIQAVDGTMFDASKQSYNVGGTLAAQVDVGETLYRNLAAKQLVKAAGHALDAQRQDSTLAAAQSYLDLARAAAIGDVVKESLRISRE
jgi:outer membrane protein TolC